MALHKGTAHQGKKTHNSKPTSKLSSQKYITKPESRETGTKMSVSGAQNYVNKMFR